MSQAQSQLEVPATARPIIGLSERSIRNAFLLAALSLLLIVSIIPIARDAGRNILSEWIRHSAGRAAIAVGAETILGVAVALLLHRLTPGYVALAAAALATVTVHAAVGTAPGRSAQSSAGWQRMPYEVWLWAPFMVLVTAGVLDAIPKRLFESASLDRLGGWFTLRTVTLPLVLPTVALAVLFRLADMARGATATSSAAWWDSPVAPYITLMLALIAGVIASWIISHVRSRSAAGDD